MTPMAFVRARWRGRVALERLLWRDTLLIGTAVNVAATLFALGLIVAGAPAWLAVVAHFFPMPYNVLLCVAVWRAASLAAEPAATLARAVSLIWLALVVIV